MLRSKFFLPVLFFIIGAQALAQVNIVPKPNEAAFSANAEPFVLSAQTLLYTDNQKLQPTLDLLNEYLRQVNGFTVKASRKPAPKHIILRTSLGAPGSYRLLVERDSIAIHGGDEAGVFYGMQSLLQLIPTSKSSSINIPAVRIQDAPRYPYRGFMLDVGRHFMPVPVIKKFMDILAYHKLNYFHWHLTDDQGWRIEIKKHPGLTQKGAYRNGTIIAHHPGTGNDNTRYGGYYSQDEIRDIVQYAAKRYITVVPEIEMPGHASAAIAAFPSLSCFPDEPTPLGKYPSLVSSQSPGKKVQESWGVHNDVFCGGNDSVFALLEDVIDEVVALFPSKLIHVGGDECPKTNWKKCPKCQQRIRQLGLKDEHGLQSYFIQRMEKYINGKGKILIGWDEILEGGLAPNAWVMSWRGEAGGIEAAKQRHDVIMTPTTYVYLDYYQGKPANEPLAIGGYLPLEKVYSYDPTPAELTPEEAKHIKGVQANLWTEYISTGEKAQYMAMPRLAALAEAAWTQQHLKNWDDFTKRMEVQYQRYDALNIIHAKSVYDVRQKVSIEQTPGKATVSFDTDSFEPEIYYTTNGSEPTPESQKYTKPFDIWRTSVIKAAVFKNGRQMGKTSVQTVVLD